ncbi:DUF3644 domain-containing protein [Desulfovibrio sp. OttesenSCG-928-G15]|nr:DUF3644 domain-containing protein [Desulfovibrio sp. OttesenSCG-928-G15]
MTANIDKIKQSYSFFVEKLSTSTEFTLQELANATGWSVSTVRTYLPKKWRPFLIQDGQLYSVNSSTFKYSEDEYARMMSQVHTYSSNPFKPKLSEPVESLVIKAKESAVLAIDIYNRPATSFRTQGFTVMMVIAWTSLLHALFEFESKDYYYRDKDNNIAMIDGDSKAWELSRCIDACEYLSHATKANITLFIQLRNKIEHRFAPAFDLDICGECQALIFNFEEQITKHFSNYYSLNNTLSIPLQVIKTRTEWQSEITKQMQSSHYNELKGFIDSYRTTLPDDIFGDSQYSFRVYLIPKTGNHRSSSDLAMEFIKYDPSQPDQFDELERGVTLIKEKRVQVANQGRYKPSQVSEQVAKRLNKPFNVTTHANAWKFYDVRKRGYQADGCNSLYCQYDEPHKDYVFTQEWIDFLVDKLADETEYNRVKAFR